MNKLNLCAVKNVIRNIVLFFLAIAILVGSLVAGSIFILIPLATWVISSGHMKGETVAILFLLSPIFLAFIYVTYRTIDNMYREEVKRLAKGEKK